MDGADTGKVTPAEFRIGDLGVGIHTVTVQKEGYHMVTPPQALRIKVDVSEIFASVILFPVALPWNAFDNKWKAAVPSSLVFRGLSFKMEQGAPRSKPAPQAKNEAKPEAQPPSAPAKGDIADRLRRLDQLRKDGLITEDEYKQRRQSMLDQI